tara:strand:+ start:2202 stop:2468 length:267 start_codon:yes stop_codon:yes gene_type:complete
MLASKIAETMTALGWDNDDDIVVEIGGTQVYGIDGHGTKWSPIKGTHKYNKDAFIVISNNSRRDLTKSQPMDREHKPHHNTQVNSTSK